MDYPHENDLRQIARPDGRRVLESWIAGTWRELVGIEIVGTRLQDSGATAHLTLSVKLPCIITMAAPTVRCVGVEMADDGTVTRHMERIRPLSTDSAAYPIARTRADLDASTHGAVGTLSPSVKVAACRSPTDCSMPDNMVCGACAGSRAPQPEPTSFADDAAALADEIVANRAEPCAIVIEEDGSPVGVVEGDVVTGDGSGAALAPFSGALKEAAANERSRREAIERRYTSHVLDDRPQLLGDELIEPRGGRYPAKRGAR